MSDCSTIDIKQKTGNIDWIAILRGLTIALVVMNHVRMLDVATGEDYAFVHEIRYLFLHLRIPTFIFVSGALLYLTRITKGWTTGALYKDKLIRIGLPLLFCTCLGCLMQVCFNGFVKHPKEMSLSTFFLSFVDYDSTPWPHRWYLISLLEMMVLYPFYRLIVKSRNVTIITFAVLAVFYCLNIRSLVDTNWCYIFSLNKYLPFFFLGIVTMQNRLWRTSIMSVCASYAGLFIGRYSSWIMMLQPSSFFIVSAA